MYDFYGILLNTVRDKLIDLNDYFLKKESKMHLYYDVFKKKALKIKVK